MMREISAGRTGRAMVVSALLCAFLTGSAWASNEDAVGARGVAGPLPIPVFLPWPNGGTAPVTLTFDPLWSYLPVNTTPGETYLYQAVWNFGDGSALDLVPPEPTNNMADVLINVTHPYKTAIPTPVNVTLTLLVFVQNDATTVVQPGPTAFTTWPVQIPNENYPPLPVMNNLSAAPNGTLPYTLTVDLSTTYDPDGYVTWAAIDWGDGTAQLVATAPTEIPPGPPSNPPPLSPVVNQVGVLPAVPPLQATHTYTAPGTYNVVFSVIDNGRIPFLQAIPVYSNESDPQGALAAIMAFQASLVTQNGLAPFGVWATNKVVNPGFSLTPQVLDPRFNPILSQVSLLVDVPISLTVNNGNFRVAFLKTLPNSFVVSGTISTPTVSLLNANIALTLGSGANALTLPAFKTSAKGKYNAQGVSFVFNEQTHAFMLKLSNAALQKALGLANATTANGSVNVPLTLTVNGVPLMSTLQFVYNSLAGHSGVGKMGHSLHNN
jgi:hypothetical protein